MEGYYIFIYNFIKTYIRKASSKTGSQVIEKVCLKKPKQTNKQIYISIILNRTGFNSQTNKQLECVSINVYAVVHTGNLIWL